MRLAPIIMVFAVALRASAAVTNIIDIGAIVNALDSERTEVNGWSFSGLSSYPDGSLKFPQIDKWLLSPDFGATILRVEANIRCSNVSPTRWLYILDENDSVVTNFSSCVKADTLEKQSLEIAAHGLSRLKLLMTGRGNTGVWGINSLSVVTSDPISSPYALRVLNATASSCVLAWTNTANCVTNRVEVFKVNQDEDGESVFLNTGFDDFSAEGNPSEKTAELSKIDPALSGVRVYSPANTNGICQIGTGALSGFLRHSGFSDYSGMALKMSLKRYPNDSSRTQRAYEVGNETNVFAVIELENEFTETIVDLSSVPSGAPILIGYDTVKSKRRVLLDSMSFVKIGAENLTPLGSCTVEATSGEKIFHTKSAFNLLPKTTYRFFVYSLNADAVSSAPSVVQARLTGGGGFCLIIK